MGQVMLKDLEGLGRQVGWGLVLQEEGEHLQRPGVERACGYLEELQTPHSLTPSFIHSSTCSGPGTVLGTGATKVRPT